MAVKPEIEKTRHAAKVSRQAPLSPEKRALKPNDQRAKCTIKISRLVRDHIEKKTTLAEPTDRTLRRLLGLKLQKGEFVVRVKDKNAEKPDAPWTTIKITEFLRDYITGHAGWNESVDHTIRRLLKLPLEDAPEKVAK